MSNSDLVWLTYADAASRLGIKPDSVRRRAAARRWPRRMGNDGKASVGIPTDILPDVTPARIPDVTPDNPDNPVLIAELSETRINLAAAHAEISGLRDRLSDTQTERDRLSGLLEKALEPKPSIIARIFRR